MRYELDGLTINLSHTALEKRDIQRCHVIPDCTAVMADSFTDVILKVYGGGDELSFCWECGSNSSPVYNYRTKHLRLTPTSVGRLFGTPTTNASSFDKPR